MAEKIVDCVGLYCPVPIAQAAQAIREVEEGERITVLADDPGVEKDFPSWCKVTGHKLVSLEETEEGFKVVIEKRKGA